MATIIFDILVAYAQYLDSFLFVLARHPYSCHNCNTTLRKPIPDEACSKNGCTLIRTCMIPQLRTRLRTRTRVTPGPPKLQTRPPDPTSGPDLGPSYSLSPSCFQPSKNVTWRSFSKTAINFACELEIGQIFFSGHLQKIFSECEAVMQRTWVSYK